MNFRSTAIHRNLRSTLFALVALGYALVFQTIDGPAQSDIPEFEAVTHNVGLITLSRSNTGALFNGLYTRQPRNYLRVGGLWVGGVLGRDTLVSTALDDLWNFSFFPQQEFWPELGPQIEIASSVPSDPNFSPTAVSEQDITVTYYDTLVDGAFTGFDFIENRQHRPLNLRVQERSFQWSFDFADDFILIDYSITNIGEDVIRGCYVGFYVDGDVFYGNGAGEVAIIGGDEFTSGTNVDDLVGFKRTFPAECDAVDTFDIAYIMDNDGDPNPPDLWNNPYSLREVMGVRVLRTPAPDVTRSFNWWNFRNNPNNFGPRQVANAILPFRDMNGFLGTPLGDRNKYYMMRNGETDYDQITAAQDHSADGWLPPTPAGSAAASGDEVRFLVSFGPVDLAPGQTAPFTVAVVAGKDLHRNPTDYADYFDPLQPETYMGTLDFTKLGANARWAGWVYDNPGVDTDNDGYRGKSRECVLSETVVYDTTLVIDSTFFPPDTLLVVDTLIVPVESREIFYEGDGAPDFRAAAPPPAPVLRVLPEPEKLTIRWNGFISENTADPITGQLDFEGYRVYLGQSNRESDYVMQTSWDLPNYNRYRFLGNSQTFELIDPPFTIEELRDLYGPDFNPLTFGVDYPLLGPDPISGEETIVYFTIQDWNQSALGGLNQIRKIYPNAPYPGAIRDDWSAADLTAEGEPKYWEYEYTIERVLSSTPAWVSVTAFDFGSRQLGLTSLESNPLRNSVQAFALNSAITNENKPLNVSVYPNPYRIDGNYRSQGYEGRDDRSATNERSRAVNFINLPPVCTIGIYSLDGDLVRHIEHNKPPDDPTAMHDFWDVLSRNLQVPASGIYYWVVETPDGRVQTGKLVLIM